MLWQFCANFCCNYFCDILQFTPLNSLCHSRSTVSRWCHRVNPPFRGVLVRGIAVRMMWEGCGNAVQCCGNSVTFYSFSPQHPLTTLFNLVWTVPWRVAGLLLQCVGIVVTMLCRFCGTFCGNAPLKSLHDPLTFLHICPSTHSDTCPQPCMASATKGRGCGADKAGIHYYVRGFCAPFNYT